MKYFAFMVLCIGTVLFTFSCKKKKSTTSTQVEQTTAEKQQEEKLKVMPYVVDAARATGESGDAFNIDNAQVIGDSLIVEVSYGGGCQLHIFSLISSGSYLKSLPLQMDLTLHHQANGDLCRAFLKNRIAFDLKPTRPTKGNELKLIINGNRDKILTYKF